MVVISCSIRDLVKTLLKNKKIHAENIKWALNMQFVFDLGNKQ